MAIWRSRRESSRSPIGLVEVNLGLQFCSINPKLTPSKSEEIRRTKAGPFLSRNTCPVSSRIIVVIFTGKLYFETDTLKNLVNSLHSTILPSSHSLYSYTHLQFYEIYCIVSLRCSFLIVFVIVTMIMVYASLKDDCSPIRYPMERRHLGNSLES